MKNKKRHKKLISNIEKDLKNLFLLYPFFIGYKLQLKGKINGKKRSKKWIIQKGKLPLNTFKTNIYYDMQHINTPSGICCIKVWLCFLKK